MQGLTGLAAIVDEIARVNETVDGLANVRKTGRLCSTMPAGATKSNGGIVNAPIHPSCYLLLNH